MNPILIVLPILTLLMFELGLIIDLNAYRQVIKQPKALLIGLTGQIVLLPLLAIFCASLFDLEPYFFIGLVLIACSPGGSSSNAFSMLAKGDVALSVTMTLLSSIITLFTLPIIMQAALAHVSLSEGVNLSLPIGNLMAQNLLLVVAPIALGGALKHFVPRLAERLHRGISRLALPLLVALVVIFFLQHRVAIAANMGQLGISTAIFILAALLLARSLSKLCKVGKAQERSIVIEVGMQNAAQSIAIASSPYIFNNDTIAIPSIIYALLMNVILLGYLWMVRRKAV